MRLEDSDQGGGPEEQRPNDPPPAPAEDPKPEPGEEEKSGDEGGEPDPEAA